VKAWAKTLGTFAAVGTLAPLALAAALHVADRTGKDGGTADGAAGQHGLAGQPLTLGAGLDFSRAISSTKATQAFGRLIMPAASGQLTLADFENNPLLESTTVVVVESAAPSAPVSLDGGGVEGASGDGGASAIFASDPAGSSQVTVAALGGGPSLGTLTGGAGMISGPSGGGSAFRPECDHDADGRLDCPSGGGSAFQPETLHLLQASGGLGDSGAGPGTGGPPGYDFDATLTVTPLPPAILAFLSGLAALFAFRRVRAKAGEPAIRC
jgi:hypothetical protein